MQGLDPTKQYIGVGLELEEARILRIILSMFNQDHPDFYKEFATKFRDGLAFQIDNELTLSGNVLAMMMGMSSDEDEQIEEDNKE